MIQLTKDMTCGTHVFILIISCGTHGLIGLESTCECQQF